jgi:hypothetical protein
MEGKTVLFWVCGAHTDKYVEYSPLGCNVVYLGESFFQADGATKQIIRNLHR